MRSPFSTVSVLLILAGIVWLSLIAIATDIHAAALIGATFTPAATSLGLITLWTLLAAAVLIAGRTAQADLASSIFVGLLLLGSVAAALATVHLCNGPATAPWMCLVIFAPPPIVAGLAIAIHSPRLRDSAPPLLINGLWCALIALVLLPCPFVAREARLQAETPVRLETATPVHLDPSAPAEARPALPATALLIADRTR